MVSTSEMMPATDDEKIVKSNCGMCQSGCGVFVHVKNGTITKIEGDPDNPFNKGHMCPKGLAAKQLVYSPDRIKYPLKRVGNRGEGKWQRISWDEALDTISSTIKGIREKDGVMAVAAGRGTSRPPVAHMRRFMNIWGNSNTFGYPHNCATPTAAVTRIVEGGNGLSVNFENSRCITAWGSNITHTMIGGGLGLMSALKKGAKFICMDPFLTPMASKADIWLQLRPGTECAMVMAWINVIIEEGLYDKEFVGKWTTGFDELTEHIKQFTPEWAEPITWVPADKIRQAARMYATTKPAGQLIGVATEFGINTTNTIHAFTILPAITGNYDIPGGNIFAAPRIPRPHLGKISLGDKVPKDVWNNHVASKHPLLALGNPTAGHYGWRAILTSKPYPIKALLIHTSNPLSGHENPKGLVYQALMKVGFLSVMDQFMTPTAELADIVLPAATWLEKDDIHRRGGQRIYACQKVIEPLWESRDDADVFRDILKRVGLDWEFDSVPEMLDYVLKPLDTTWQEFKDKGWFDERPKKWKKYEQGLLRPDKKPGFFTPSGKIELYSQSLEEMGLDPLPNYIEPPESPFSDPKLMEEYPLVLTTGIRSPVFFHSQYRQLPWLREIHPDPIVRINPETAEPLGIKDGDWVYIESPRGRCKQKAKVTLGIDPRVVLAEHHWWFPDKPAPEYGIWESNINLLVSSDPPYDPGVASTPARSLVCKVYKVEEDK